MSRFKDLCEQYYSTGDTSKELISSIAFRLDSSTITEGFCEIAFMEQQKEELEPWDGDNSDIISRYQSFISDVLARVPQHLLASVVCGLKHESRDVRCYVSVALIKRGDSVVLNDLKAALELESEQLTRIILTKAIIALGGKTD